MQTPRIDVWYGLHQSFGHAGIPQRFANIPGRVYGDIQSLVYTLNGGLPVSLSTGADGRRLAAKGDFNADIAINDLHTGSNEITLTATSPDNTITHETVTLDYAPHPCSLPYTVDWQHISRIQDVAHVVDGQWHIHSDTISPIEIGYDRLIAIGDLSWHDYEVTVPITIHGINAGCYAYPSAHAGVGIVLRWQGHHDWGADNWASGQPLFGPSPYGGIAWHCVFHDTGPEFNIFDSDFNRHGSIYTPLNLHMPYLFKARVETIAPEASRYTLKVWPQSQPEPDGWTVETTLGPPALTQGALLLGAHHVACAFGNVQVTPL